MLAKINSMARHSGNAIRPWPMGTQSERSRKPLTNRKVYYITRVCAENGWDELAHAVKAGRLAIEQESQTLRLPQ
ncbi:hypothetical protein [Nevskia soli]|uniref:hypothetical protein n=1 Tax=Nevskia soli TaxID=418856 RepID=UPI0004A733DA|nr:hypothetical protein [Nevskia soli]